MVKPELDEGAVKIIIREANRLMCLGDSSPVKLSRGAEAMCLGVAYNIFGIERIREVVESIELPEDAEPFRGEIADMLIRLVAALGKEMGGTPSKLLGMLSSPGAPLVREYIEKIRDEMGVLPDLGMRITADTPTCLAELNNWGNIVMLAGTDPASAAAAMRFLLDCLAKQTLPVAILVDDENAPNMAGLAEMHVLAELVRGDLSTIDGVREALRGRKRRGVLLAWSAERVFGPGLEILTKSNKLAELGELLASEEASLLTALGGLVTPPPHRPESNLFVHRAQLREKVIDPTKPDSRPGTRLYIDDVEMAEK